MRNQESNTTKASQGIQANVTSKVSMPSIYKVSKEDWTGMTDKQRKTFRRARRNELKKIEENILGKDRSAKEVADAIKALKKNFKTYYLAKELTVEALYAGNDQSRRDSLQQMLDKVNA